MIIVAGTPGVGKTVVSKRLATELGALHIDLADLVRRDDLTNGFDKQRQTVIVDTEKLAQRLRLILQERQGLIVIDGHYATSVVPKNQVTQVFLLRRHPKQLKQQMEDRGFSGEKLWENLAAEILDVSLYDAIKDMGNEKVCEIDTTDKTVDEIVDEILGIDKGEKECRVGIVDWLGKLEEESILDQYLRWSS